ncbi:MAG: hypothetical protein ACLP8B_15020 [Xanthobacteraceae bacterium]
MSPLRDGYHRHLHELAWMMATVAALVCCSIAIVTMIVAFVAGDHSYSGGAEMTLGQYGDELSYDFEILGAPAAPRYEGSGPSPEAGIDACQGVSWPNYSGDCLWSTEEPRHRRPARARSFWCSGLLRHQPFCNPRSR